MDEGGCVTTASPASNQACQSPTTSFQESPLPSPIQSLCLEILLSKTPHHPPTHKHLLHCPAVSRRAPHTARWLVYRGAWRRDARAKKPTPSPVLPLGQLYIFRWRPWRGCKRPRDPRGRPFPVSLRGWPSCGIWGERAAKGDVRVEAQDRVDVLTPHSDEMYGSSCIRCCNSTRKRSGVFLPAGR